MPSLDMSLNVCLPRRTLHSKLIPTLAIWAVPSCCPVFIFDMAVTVFLVFEARAAVRRSALMRAGVSFDMLSTEKC